MSLNRLALRFAAVAALTNNGKAPWPTLAQQRVYDSRLDPVEKIVGDDGPYPLIGVYTDRSANLWHRQKGGDKPRTVHLFLECSVAIRQNGPEAGEFDIGVPLTDSESETTLDILSAQMHRALFGFDPFNRIVQGIVQTEDTRAATTDGQRLAVYFTDIEVEVLADISFGKVPDHFRPLIDVLADSPAYAERAKLLERFCTDPASLTQAQIRRLAQQWPAATASALGYPE